MKNKFIKYYIAAFYFCSTLVLFAQPGSGSDNGGIDDSGATDTTPAPIGDYLWVLAIIGLVLVYLKFRAIHKQAHTDSK